MYEDSQYNILQRQNKLKDLAVPKIRLYKGVICTDDLGLVRQSLENTVCRTFFKSLNCKAVQHYSIYYLVGYQSGKSYFLI